MEPPSVESVSSAIKRLQDVGAFDNDDNLTALGEILATLPVDVRIGKLMLFGAIFQVNKREGGSHRTFGNSNRIDSFHFDRVLTVF